MKANLLIVDDEPDMLKLLQRSISRALECDLETVGSGEQALEKVARKSYDLVLLDIRMPGIDGMETLERMTALDPWVTVVMMTAFGAIEIAVEAVKKGAYDFITKPFEHDEIIRLLKKALERGRLLRDNLRLRQRIKTEESFQGFIGASPKMQNVYDAIQMISNTDVNVLITGESGTGKNLAAKAIHALSSRSKHPFVRVSCPTVPENILESELFGYAKGAFTHAFQSKKGLFEEAEGGTIFLDEIGDISLAIQTKLLQVLDEKEFKPLGQNKNVRVNARIITATNRDLEEKMNRNEFRKDLFYRLQVTDIHMPPLRERKEDIPLLVEYFLEKYCARFDMSCKRISNELMAVFLERRWDGNVRELANTLKKAIVLTPSNQIAVAGIGWKTDSVPAGIESECMNELSYRDAKNKVLEKFNTRYVNRILEKTGGNVTQAARLCGLERQSLQHIMKKCGIRSDHFRR